MQTATYNQITSLMERLENITANTPADDAVTHRNLLEARSILRPWQHLEAMPQYKAQIDNAVAKALKVYGKPPYPEFFAGIEPLPGSAIL